MAYEIGIDQSLALFFMQDYKVQTATSTFTTIEGEELDPVRVTFVELTVRDASDGETNTRKLLLGLDPSFAAGLACDIYDSAMEGLPPTTKQGD